MKTKAILGKRGVHGVVQINANVLFAPGADIPNWKRRLSARVNDAAQGLAPSNKRPRWAHYGVPLRRSFTATTKTQITKHGGFTQSGVGSRAPYSMYVDQGTGIYSGRGPYQAKILPPWFRGSPSLYEHTWRPGPGERPVGTVTVRGQKGQFFMAKALKAGLTSMRLRSYQLPGEGVSGVSDKKFISSEALFAGNTPWSFAFDAQLREWRQWRDEAWNSRGRGGTRTPLGEHDALQRRILKLMEERQRHQANMARRKEIRKTVSADSRRKKRQAREAKNRDDAAKVLTKKKSETTRVSNIEKSRIREWLIGNFNRAGYPYVDNVFINDDGTWTAYVRRSRDESWRGTSGRWK